MKKVLLGVVLVASGAISVAASSTLWGSESVMPTTASGEGTMSFGEHGHETVGFFLFEVERGPQTSGSLVFAAEYHEHGARYPEIVVRVPDIEYAVLGQRSIRFAAMGTQQEEPVFVAVSAFDSEGTTRPDKFTIVCINIEGEVVFEAEGEVVLGDILVGEPE
jgi:hypothetical protein